MDQESYIGVVSQDQIDAWKSKYSKVFAVKVDGHICYLKEPDRKILGYASVAGKTDPLKFNEVIMNSCFIGGSELIKTDLGMFLGASSVIANIIQVKEAELVNL
ncbi:MAG: hypothetical protein WCO44_12405 [Bacteroidota bacterium]